MKARLLIGALALTLSSIFPAFAQEKDETVAEVRDPSGEIRASTGGSEFTVANLGKRLKDGDRILVGQDSKVTVKWDNGCDRTYEDAGVYTIDRSCAAALWGGSTGKVVGGVAVGAWLLSRQGDSRTSAPSPPVSR